MPQTTLGVQRLVNPLTGAVVTLTWALVATRAMTTEHPVSVSGLVAAAASAIAGIGFGVLVASLATGHARRRGRTVPAPGHEGVGTFFLLIGLVEVGWGLEPALEPSPTGWTWFSLLFAFAGGASVGLSLLLGVSRPPSSEPRVGVPSQDPPTHP